MPTPDQRRTGDTSVSNHLIRARILVVEDQRDVRGLIVTALEIEGHQVDEASNAHEGLQKLQERRYDLVLTDFAMFGAVVFETMAVASIFMFRWKRPDAERSYRCVGYPWTPIIYVVCYVGLIASYFTEEKRVEAYSGLGFALAGAVVYILFLRRR